MNSPEYTDMKCPTCLSKDLTDLEVRVAIDGGISLLQRSRRAAARKKWEMWSVAVALAKSSGEKNLERVVNCPGLDCEVRNSRCSSGVSRPDRAEKVARSRDHQLDVQIRFHV